MPVGTRYDQPLTMNDVLSLPAGTLIDLSGFVCLVVGDNLLLVVESANDEYAREGSLLSLTQRGANDWGIAIRTDDFPWGDRFDFWVQRDWNGNLKCRGYDLYDYDSWDDDYWVDDYPPEYIAGYDDDSYDY